MTTTRRALLAVLCIAIFGVSPLDAVTLVGTAAVVLVSALVASALPAIAAARVDPMITLRDQ